MVPRHHEMGYWRTESSPTPTASTPSARQVATARTEVVGLGDDSQPFEMEDVLARPHDS